MREHALAQTADLLKNLTKQIKQLKKAPRDDDAEAIHDVRVAIRRLRACLRICATFYPDKTWKKVRRKLAEIMQCCGDVRDRDIALELLADAGVADDSKLVRRLRKERRAADRELRRELTRSKKSALGRESKRGTKDQDSAASAGRELPLMVGRFFADTRDVLAKPLTADTLHKRRIAGRKLRYTLELFRAVYPAELEERLAELKKLQDWLGAAHDVAAAREIIGRRALQGHAEIAEYLDKREAAQVAGFTRYWKKTFDAKGQEAWWTDFLARQASPPRPAL